MGNCASYVKRTSNNRYVDKRKTIPITEASPVPESLLSENSFLTMSSSSRARSDSINRFRSTGYLRLHADGQLTNELVPFRATHPPVDLSDLSGMYAYCLVQSEQGQQYLLVNPLITYQSNHGLFILFLKKLPEKTNVIAAGEILFFNSKIMAWNLKSMGFSQNTGLDESNPNFEENRKHLWLPQAKYQSIAEAESFVHRFFTGSGSPLLEAKESHAVQSVPSLT